jgi:hypothetical protein
MIFDKSNQADFIENRKCQWHFQNSNILKLLIHINIKILFIYFGFKSAHILNNNKV